jgi:hypothetical protein
LSVLFHPAVDADEAAFLFKADDAMDLCLGQGSDLVIAQAALGTLKS